MENFIWTETDYTIKNHNFLSVLFYKIQFYLNKLYRVKSFEFNILNNYSFPIGQL